MAKKSKDVEVVPNEVPDTGLLNPKVAEPQPVATMADIIIAEVDFNELLELEKAVRQTESQHDKIAGNIKRLEKDLDAYYAHEKNLTGQIDAKRKELIKRYKIEEQRTWRIDINNRKVVYQN